MPHWQIGKPSMTDNPQANDAQDWEDDWPEDHRSGVVAIVGRPNVGKSSLVNTILGQKIAIATHKPQTTRRQQLGIYSNNSMQIMFVDTPGLHKPHNRLGEFMQDAAESALYDADVVIWIMDASQPLNELDLQIAPMVAKAARKRPVLLVLNKIDLVRDSAADFSAHLAQAEGATVLHVSAATGAGVPDLLEAIQNLMPLGPRYYPIDQVSDLNMRFMASEVIREKLMLNTEQEIPYAAAVAIETYNEDDDRTTIEAVIYVERDSQKGIVIGKGGQMIKKIGIQARQELIAQIGGAVHLGLQVKVLKNWRDNEEFMRRVGYRIPRPDER